MNKHRQTSNLKKMLAWLLMMVMMCTSVCTPALASEFSSGVSTEWQNTDENTENISSDNLDDPFTDGTVEQGNAGAAAAYSSDTDLFMDDVDDISADPATDTDTIELKVFDVRFKDTDGYFVKPNGSNASNVDNDYWAYLTPGMTCPSTVPEPTIATSAWNNCNDYTYTWDTSYIKITIPNTCTINNMRWEENVLKFTVKDGDTSSKDFTLTMKDTNFAGTSAAELITKIQQADFGITMADSYDAVKNKIETAKLDLPDGINIGLTTKQNNYKHDAQAGTVENPNGTDGKASLYINVSFIDETTKYPVYFFKNSNSTYSISTVVKALAYSEADKVNVTAVASGNGTAMAEFAGMVAQQRSDKSYKWITKYTISATPTENNRLVIWTYQDGENLKTAGNGVKTTITTDTDRTYTANFAENTAPVVKATANNVLTTTARKKISQSVSSWFEDKTTVTVNDNVYSLDDKLTYSATLDGEALSTDEFTSSGQLKWVTDKAGTYNLVITATDDLGAKVEHKVPITVSASAESQYKVGISATYMGEPKSLGEDGLKADITYAAGYSGDYPLENLDNEYYKGDNQYVITIDNWNTVRDENQFTEMKIGDLTVTASDIPTNGAKQFSLNGKKNAFRLYYYSSSGKLVITINYGANKITSASLKEDLILQLAFCDVDKVLKVNAGEHGAVSQIAYKGEEDGKYTYAVYAKPDLNYQLISYTVKGKTEPVQLDLDAESYDRTTQTNVFQMEIEEDTEITLNFASATIDLELWSYVPDTSSKAQTASYWYMGIFNHQFGANGKDRLRERFEENSTSIPLVEGMGQQFWIKANIKGFMEPNPEEDVNGWVSVLKMYSGDTVSEENLFFDSTDSDTVCDSGNPYSVGKGYVMNGEQSGGLYATVMSCPDMDKITVVLKFGGYVLQKTFDVETASNVAEVKEFAKYYTDTYGLDKFGQELYTAEEKATESYAKYCKYSNFRYVLRLAYNKYYALIAQTPEAERAAKLAEGKKALDDAAVGAGCNAVVWSFKEQGGVKAIPVMVAVPNDVEDYSKHPSAGTNAHNTMCAALEALYPGSWGYTYTATQFGAFVNSVTAGGEDDTGKVHVRISSGGTGANYGFWFYNGKFSEWGVSNYNPYDGDVMWWGDGDVEKNWNWALLRLKYGDAGLDSELGKRGASTTIDKITATELETLFPEVDFKRYGQFRELTSVELVEIKIGQIGTVTPDSGDAINAAKAAYEALSEADKAKVRNYQTLADAIKTYESLSSKVDIDYSTALGAVLTAMKDGQPLGSGSTNGEWAILSLARSGLIKGTDTSGQAVNYQKALKTAELSSSTDYARAVLALSSLGVSASDDLIAKCKDYDAAVEQGINAVAYCLLALDTKPYDAANTEIRDKYIKYILDNACADGGWLYGDATFGNADVDMTAMVIQALARYYGEGEGKRADVTAAVDKALNVLASMQKNSGGFSSYDIYNAESTAQVITALTSIGKDPTTWNGKDAVNALLKFYDKDNSMFRHTLTEDKDQMATEQAAYALVAYNRFKNNKNRLYDMSDVLEAEPTPSPIPTPSLAPSYPNQGTVDAAKNAIEALGQQTVSMDAANTEDAILALIKSRVESAFVLKDITGPTCSYAIKMEDGGSKLFKAAVAGTADAISGTDGSFTVTVTISMEGAENVSVDVKGVIRATSYTPPSSDITVSFALYGDTQHSVASDTDLHTYRFNSSEMETWISNTYVTVSDGATVGDVFKKVLDEKGFTYTGLNNNYISAITNDKGVTLKHKQNTSYSGWMYLVNGTHPNVGLNTKKVSNGDVIIWHWTDKYQLEEGSSMYDSSAAASYVSNLISAIADARDASAYNSAITKARAAYDKLTSEEKAKVSNYDNLETAEKTPFDPDKKPSDDTNKPSDDTNKPSDDTNKPLDPSCKHKYDEGKVTKEATCKEEGVKTYTCSVCGGTKTEAIAKTSHKFGKWMTSAAASITAPEKQERICSICGEKETRDYGKKLSAMIKLDVKSVILTKNGKMKIEVTMANGDAVKSWKSSDKTIVTVDKKGVLTAGNKIGTAKVTVTLVSGKKATLTVEVQEEKITTTQISGLKKKITLKKGKKLTLKPVITPSNSEDKVTYKSSKKSVVSVSSKGVLTAKKAGTAKITVTSGSKKVTVTVTVPKVKTKSLKVSDEVSVKKGKKLSLNVKVSPSNSDEKVTYTSSDKKIVTVDKNGKIKGIKKGTATITVKSGTIKKTIKVTVTK